MENVLTYDCFHVPQPLNSAKCSLRVDKYMTNWIISLKKRKKIIEISTLHEIFSAINYGGKFILLLATLSEIITNTEISKTPSRSRITQLDLWGEELDDGSAVFCIAGNIDDSFQINISMDVYSAKPISWLMVFSVSRSAICMNIQWNLMLHSL